MVQREDTTTAHSQLNALKQATVFQFLIAIPGAQPTTPHIGKS